MSIHGSGKRGYTILTACLANTDNDLLGELARLWPVALTIVRQRNPRHRNAGEWRLRGGTAALFLSQILPFVRSARMQVRIRLALEFDGRRRQGSRDPNYKTVARSYAAAMRLLNAKGAFALDPAFLAHLLDPRTNQTIYEQLTETGKVELAAPLALPPGGDDGE